MRDQVVDYVNYWSERAEVAVGWILRRLGVRAGKFHSWRERYGKANEHNGRIPRDFWLEEWEKEAIVEYAGRHPGEGYRRLAYMMMDEDAAAVSPTTVWRVLNRAGLLAA